MIFLLLSAVAVVGAVFSPTQAQQDRIARASELYNFRPFLRADRPDYRNYALQTFTNYSAHSWPYDEASRTYYGFMGNRLSNGYDLYKWEETRAAGQTYGSAIFKPNEMYNLQWEKVYNSVVVLKDGYGSWGYSFVIGDNLIARFTPLTLSMTDFNGFRFDLSLPTFKATALASRIERPHTYQELPNVWAIEKTHFADDSTLLVGGRLQADAGIGSVGFNLTNSHVYRSTENNNSRKGILRPDQPLMDWVIVRFSDDSPRDGVAGASVQNVELILNGQKRSDIVPLVVSNSSGIQPQVGTVSSATGRFRATDYTLFSGHRLYYRGRDDVPLYSDYMVRRDHETGEDISKISNLKGILENFQIESPTEVLRADGDREVAFLYDLSAEPLVESVEIEAFLGNDYRVDVATLFEVNTRGKTYHARYKPTFYKAVLRAMDNPRDMSNFKKVRFAVGEDTGILVYSADASLTLPGLEVTAEYARSAVYSRFPAHMGRLPRFGSSPRFAKKDHAYFINATHWFRGGRLGAEAFSINPEYTTSFRTYLDEQNFKHTNLDGMLNDTVYWDLVEDNDDGDRFPDRRYGNVVGFTNDSAAFDLDGIHLNQDVDNDGLPEINRDGDDFPDYDEPFLMFDVEPNSYVYGLDRNNNDEPDLREDDGLVDYPYDPDHRGYHLFAQFDLTPQWSFAVGHYAVSRVAGPGRTKSTYALLGLDIRRVGGQRLLTFENNFRRVQDDIADEYLSVDEVADRSAVFTFRGLGDAVDLCGGNACPQWYLIQKPPIFSTTFVADLLEYQDSYVNESYVELEIKPVGDLHLVQRGHARFNWQQGGKLYNQTFQQDRRVDFWSTVTRLQWPIRWGKLSVTPQYKLMMLREIDRERNVAIRAENRSIPILRLQYALSSRTSLRGGLQGLGPLPYRLEDKTAKRKSFKQRTAFITLENSSKYFGYELITIVGVRKDKLEFDTPLGDGRDLDIMSLFVRGLIGFTDFGRPI